MIVCVGWGWEPSEGVQIISEKKASVRVQDLEKMPAHMMILLLSIH